MAKSSRIEKSDGVVKAKAPTKKEKITLRILIVFGLIFLTLFLTWFFSMNRMGYAPLFWPLTIALLFKLLKKIHEWYHYWNLSVPKMPESKRKWTADVFTTYCPGEPKEMIYNTLTAMKNITYPHTTYLCDEADDPEIKKFCKDNDIVHVTRTEKVNAKAGNINNALKQATGEICVVLDPDHVPVPEFLDRVLPYFENEEIGYVQCVQAYKNRRESFVAYGAAEQTYHFYGPIMMCMNSYGTAQAIGANCTFRRKALDSIGGHAAGLSEDMHTAMQIHSKGWKSHYVPEILTRGLVPSTLSGYYKQQLKWSRGCFELLFVTYPKLVKNFTKRQALHYFMLPLYFLLGLVSFIDMTVPAVALVMAEVPWLVNLNEFTMMFIPLLVINLLIRQYAQRWLLEEHERGFHLIGGLLRIGTWWVFIVGFIYTLFRIKVPYIPTPKDDKPENSWKLCLPNLVVIGLSLIAIVYGLSIDWSPYSFFMASFAGVNVLILAFVTIISQQKLIVNIYNSIKKNNLVYSYMWLYRIILWKTRHRVYSIARVGSVYFSLGAIFIFLVSYTYQNTDNFKLATLAPKDMKFTGGYYSGVYIPSIDKELKLDPVLKLEKSVNSNFEIVSFYQAWGPESLEKFPMEFLNQVSEKGRIPMITWEPWSSTFPEFKKHPELGIDRKICLSVYNGKFDNYLKEYAAKVRAYGEPVFIRFAHEPSNNAYPWGPDGGNSPDEYIAAWQHVVTLFKEEGVSNVTWVWNPLSSDQVYNYFPGGEYVDWIGLTALNYGKASHDGKWRSFEEIYEPYRDKLNSLKRPVMLAEFGTTGYGGKRSEWLDNALTKIKNDYTEIKSVVFFNSDKDKNWITSWRPQDTTNYINWVFDQDSLSKEIVNSHMTEFPYDDNPILKRSGTENSLKPKARNYSSKFVKGKPGNYDLVVNGKPWYIKGVAYNSGHDWRDGDYPLIRKNVLSDLKKIKDMGANMIRRYGPGVYDRNILNIAEEQKLKVLYGFWFSPKVDYYKDSAKVQEYINEVEEVVRKYKDHPAVLGWSVGNETWGLLKHKYSNPYLTKVRRGYVKMIEHLAQRIHEIDPSRPVCTASEHEEDQLPGELAAFHDGAPSIDYIAINSYYIEQISQLQKVTYKMDSTRPYLISEFGPKGYWNPDYSRLENDSVIIEDSEFEKAVLYTSQWKNYVEENKGYNIGGVVYSWRDRLEGTATWFGITDYKGRTKPAYHAMRALWTGQSSNSRLHNLLIEGPSEALKPGVEYEFSAKTDNNLYRKKRNLKYEWHLRREEYLEFVGDMKEVAEGQKVKLVLPEEPSNYRLYLYISDEEGNVVTASRPLPIN